MRLKEPVKNCWLLLRRLTKTCEKPTWLKGSETIANVALGSSAKANYLIDYKSIMGVTVPVVEFQSENDVKPDYGFANTSVELDQTFKQFQKILELIADLARSGRYHIPNS